MKRERPTCCFSIDGTLIEAWAGYKSFRRKDGSTPPPTDDPGNPTVDFHGEKRSTYGALRRDRRLALTLHNVFEREGLRRTDATQVSARTRRMARYRSIYCSWELYGG